jgi:membrane fusion protein, multidrug efflux system
VKRKITLTAAVLFVAFGAGGIWYLRSERAPKQAEEPAMTSEIPVVAAEVTSADVPIYLTGVGTVVAYNTDVVRSQIQGQITQITFVEGRTVKAGDLLAQIDPRPYEAQIEQLTANLNRDQAQLTNAQANQTRYTQLGNEGFATPQLVETQNAQVEQLQSEVKADQALIDQAKIKLGYTRLTSPIPGITGVRQIDVGNIIHPNDPNGLVVVTQVEPISLIFTLPELDLSKIQTEMAKAPLKVIAYSQDNKVKLGEGKLLLVDNEIVQSTGSIQLKAEFANSAHRLWPGQLVNVNLLLDVQKNGLTIAASAIQQGQNRSYVYVVTADSTAQLRPVKVAQISQGQALIEDGLKAGETVVIDGQYRLQQGSHVRLLHGKAADEADLQSAVQKAIP